MQLPLIANMKKLPAPWMLGLAAAGLVGISATTFVIARQAAPKGNSSELTVPAQTKDVTVQITASGSVVPVQTVNLSPKTAGRLVKLMVEQGDRVTQGQLIARMEGTELKSDRDLALANLAQAEASLSLVQAGNRPEAIGQQRQVLTRHGQMWQQPRLGWIWQVKGSGGISRSLPRVRFLAIASMKSSTKNAAPALT